ncbi:MAG: flavodoxin family protein [Armatimonadetes bacterium]|nr:flavodoxin family protein [Armatimonadota bacterium]
MPETRIFLVVYHSENGHTEQMANWIAEGLEDAGAAVAIKKVEELDLSYLPACDGLVIGSPTYFSNVSWPIKKFIDESIVFYDGKQIKGRVGGTFTSSGTYQDARECLMMLDWAFRYHHEMNLRHGVIRVDGQEDAMVAELCKVYGRELVEMGNPS